LPHTPLALAPTDHAGRVHSNSRRSIMSSYFPHAGAKSRLHRFPLIQASVLTSLLLGLSSAAQAASPAACELDRAVRLGGMNWESNLVLTEVERFIADKGYGCKTEVVSVETLPALAALERGDLDVNSEIWLNSVADPWKQA